LDWPYLPGLESFERLYIVVFSQLLEDFLFHNLTHFEVCSNGVVSDQGRRFCVAREWCFFCCCPYQVLDRIHATQNRSACLSFFSFANTQQTTIYVEPLAGKSSIQSPYQPRIPLECSSHLAGILWIQPPTTWSGRFPTLYIDRSNVPHHVMVLAPAPSCHLNYMEALRWNTS